MKQPLRRVRLEALEERRLLAVTAVNDEFNIDEDTVLSVGPVMAAELGGEWLYFNEIIRGIRSYPDGNQPAAWNELAYHTTNPEYGSWKTGNAIFGYGPDLDAGPTVTDLNAPSSNYTTTLFRRTFMLDANQAQAATGTLTGVFDDGAIIYVNGNEIHAVNPPAIVGTDEFAGSTVAGGTGRGGSEAYATATVDLTEAGLVAGANVVAVELHNASAASADTGMDMSLVIESTGGSILENDSTDFPPDPTLTAALIPNAGPSNGNLDPRPDGTFIYTPNANYSGIDHFLYRATDGQGLSDTAIVTINIASVEDPPVAVDDTYEILEDSALQATRRWPNVFLIEQGASWDYYDQIDSEFMPGGAEDYPVDAQGDAWNDPDFDHNWPQGPAIFGYGTINGGPIATTLAGAYAGTGGHGVTTYLFRSEVQVTDASGIGQLQLGLLADDNGVLYINGQEVYRTPSFPAGAVTADLWVPSGFNGENFDDNAALLNVDGILVNGLNTVAFELHQGTSGSNDVGFDMSLKDVTESPGLLVGDFDPEGDAIESVQIVPGSGPNHGVLELVDSGAGDGRFTYTPNRDFNGVDGFQYTIAAGGLTSRPGTVAINVQAVPDLPVANDNDYLMYADRILEASAELGLLADDVDPDGTAPSVSAFTEPIDTAAGEVVGELQVDTDGAFSFTPPLGYEGEVAFDYALQTPDGRDATGHVVITVLESPDPPVVLVDSLLTNDPSPQLTGIVSHATAAIDLEVADDTYPAVNNGDFTWILPGAVISDLAEGTYDVIVRATNQNGTGTDRTVGELEIDLTAPLVAIDRLLTSDGTPELTGTVSEPNIPVRVTIDGTAYDAVNHDNGTWSLPSGTISPALVTGVYDMTVEATDGAGNVGFDATVDELEIDLTAPVVSVDTQGYDDSTPPITGTVDDPSATVTVSIGGFPYQAFNNADGTWTLPDDTIELPLANGTYDVAVEAVDIAGNSGYDATVDELTIDIQTIVVTVHSLATADPTPQLTGRVNDPEASILVTVGGSPWAAQNNADGTWVLPDNAITTPLQPGIYSVDVRAENGLVVGFDPSDNELTVDVTPPVVTVDPLFTHDEFPALSGTVDDPMASVEIWLDGLFYPAENDGNGIWTIPAGVAGPLADGVYDVVAIATDPLGNVGTDETAGELTADVWPVPIAMDDTYSVSYLADRTVPAHQGVLANDYDSEGNPLSATLVTDTTQGQLTFSTDGSFEYQADPYFVGVDSFTYRAVNDWHESETATVWLDVGTVDGVFVVDSLEDLVANDGQITLREALWAANSNAPVNDAPAGRRHPWDRILFHPDLFVAGSATITLTGVPLNIDDAVVIEGPGTDLLTIDADGKSPVLYLNHSYAAELSGLTLTGGRSSIYGSYGGIRNYGHLTLDDVQIRGNSATNSRGGIYNIGNLTVINSTISDNFAEDDGGGIMNTGTATIIDSTIADNWADKGGGIYNTGTMTIVRSAITGNVADDYAGIRNAGTVNVVDSIVVGNAADDDGGGLFNTGVASLVNTTVAGNFAETGGGVFGHVAGDLTVVNSIIAENAGRSPADLNGPVTPESGFNLIGVDPHFVRSPDPGPDGWWGTADDDLGDLRLAAGSPAIDGGDNVTAVDPDGSPLTIDLVGTTRLLDGNADGTATVDVGAFEFVPPVLARHVAYGGSSFDDGTAGGAVAHDKRPLFAGQTASAANVTSYDAGIVAVAIDVNTPGGPYEFSAADFAFHIGNVDDPAAWATAPAPSGISTNPGAGIDGSTRVLVAWADDAIKNTWLRVTVRAGEHLGLIEDDTSYFGNAVGETTSIGAGLSTRPLILVNASDVIAIRDNPRGPANPAAIDDPHDVNRDMRVDALDMVLARDNATSPLTGLRLITPSAAIGPPLAESEGIVYPAGEAVFGKTADSTATAAMEFRSQGESDLLRLLADGRWWEKL